MASGMETESDQFTPYTVELVMLHAQQPPTKHYICVYKNGEHYAIELHKEYFPASTSQIAQYGKHWIITKARRNQAVTEYVVTTPGGWITRYTLPTSMAHKLQNDIVIYEAQQKAIPKPVNPSLNTNEHFISQVLLRRFCTNGRLQVYRLKIGKWSKRGTTPEYVFSDDGYNQLLAFGESNTELDERLKSLEDTLPITLDALDNAAKDKETKLDPEIYKRMCSYCAFLWEMSPFCKLAAPVNYICQLMFELNLKNTDSLDAVGVKDEDIAQIIRHHANGGKFIITSRSGKNYRQLAYRLSFSKQLASLDKIFKEHTAWTVARSPIELPIGDMALIKYHLPATNAMESILPLSPTLVLIGNSPMGAHIQPSTETVIKGGTLTESEAEYVQKVICQGALSTIASNTQIGDINELRKKPVVNLMQLQNVEEILKSGLTEITSQEDFLITPASMEDYVKWVHSFIIPPPKETT
jgi:hypothetical protein